MNPNNEAIWRRMYFIRFLQFAHLDGPDDRRELSSVRTITAASFDTRSGDAHGDADVGRLERGRTLTPSPVMARRFLLLRMSTRRTLSSAYAGDDSDLVDLLLQFVVLTRQLGAWLGLDAQLAGDRRGGDRVVPGDHAHPDAPLCLRDGDFTSGAADR